YWDASTVVAACKPDATGAVGVRGEVSTPGDEWVAGCPGVGARVVDVHLVRRVGRDSAAAHDIHLPIEAKRSRLPRGPRYWCYCANRVSHGIEAKRVGGIDHQGTLEIRRTSHVDDAVYGARRRIHDPFRCVCFLCPPGACRSIGIKLPDLVGRA